MATAGGRSFVPPRVVMPTVLAAGLAIGVLIFANYLVGQEAGIAGILGPIQEDHGWRRSSPAGRQVLQFRGVREGRTTARRIAWFTRAAELGSADGEAMLGSLYVYGHGVTRDPSAAYKLLGESADHGSRLANCYLAELYLRGDYLPRDPERAVALLRAAEEYPDAKSILGQMYLFGNGVPRKPGTAFDLLSAAAEGNAPGAQLLLGEMYMYGVAVAQDPIEAARWFQLASDHGNPVAQFRLARIFQVGSGVPMDAHPRDKAVQRRRAAGLCASRSGPGPSLLPGDRSCPRSSSSALLA